MQRFRGACLAVTLLALAPAQFAPLALADIVDAVNSIRRDGCGGLRGGLPPLQRQTALSAAARRLADGIELDAALADAGYRAAQAYSAHVNGSTSGAQTVDLLVRRSCMRLLDARLTETGGYEHGTAGWVILAAPAPVAALDDRQRAARRVLALVNAARAHARSCGAEAMAASAPLTWSDALMHAAHAHALDMERNDFFDHTGSDGSVPLTRFFRAGYAARIAGENLAFNQESPDEVVRGWLESPHHCANIMDPRFRDLGVSWVVSRRPDQSIYWDLALGAP